MSPKNAFIPSTKAFFIIYEFNMNPAFNHNQKWLQSTCSAHSRKHLLLTFISSFPVLSLITMICGAFPDVKKRGLCLPAERLAAKYQWPVALDMIVKISGIIL
ncbi:hypothetical protein [Thiolapillus sp.]